MKETDFLEKMPQFCSICGKEFIGPAVYGIIAIYETCPDCRHITEKQEKEQVQKDAAKTLRAIMYKINKRK